METAFEQSRIERASSRVARGTTAGRDRAARDLAADFSPHGEKQVLPR